MGSLIPPVETRILTVSEGTHANTTTHPPRYRRARADATERRDVIKVIDDVADTCKPSVANPYQAVFFSPESHFPTHAVVDTCVATGGSI